MARLFMRHRVSRASVDGALCPLPPHHDRRPAVFAALVTWIGIYASAFLYIGFFMRWLGKYAWWKVAAVSAVTVTVFYLVFEKWFKVPLPKGPLENFLGLG